MFLQSWKVELLSTLTLLLFVLALGLGLASSQGDDGVDKIIDLGYTRYNGKAFRDGTARWLGMRYAAPPIGNLRFAAPQKPANINATISAFKVSGTSASTSHVANIVLQLAKRCLSTHSTVKDRSIPKTLSEDCLFANVYAPASANNTSNLPVFLFIQGGGFNESPSSNDGGKLLKASGLNIVIVTFTYRVGPWGFLASKEVQTYGSLNNGLKDQRQILYWIQQHIRKVSQPAKK